jgi:DNA-binding NarL/FixJ family response regulator
MELAESRDVGDLHRRYLRGAESLLGSDAHGIYMLGEDARPLAVATQAAPSGFLDDYERDGRATDPLLAHLVEQRSPVHERMLFSAREWREVPLRSVLRAWDLEHSLQAPLLLHNNLVGTLNFARAPRSSPFSDADLSVALWLGAQVAAAFRRVTVYQSAVLSADLRRGCLETINVPVVVTDESGRVVEVNRAGRMHLAPFGNEQLRPAVASAVIANVEQLREGPETIVRRLAQPEPPYGVGYWVRTRRIEGTGGQCHYASTFVPAGSGGSAVPCGAEALGPREQEVVKLVADGLTNAQIAERLVISPNTVKDHLKRVHRKLGASTRAEVAVWAERHLS